VPHVQIVEQTFNKKLHNRAPPLSHRVSPPTYANRLHRFRRRRKGLVNSRVVMIGAIPIRSFGTNRSHWGNMNARHRSHAEELRQP